jgi:hypothetical protein
MQEPCNLRYLLKQEITRKTLQQRDRKDLKEGDLGSIGKAKRD